MLIKNSVAGNKSSKSSKVIPKIGLRLICVPSERYKRNVALENRRVALLRMPLPRIQVAEILEMIGDHSGGELSSSGGKISLKQSSRGSKWVIERERKKTNSGSNLKGMKQEEGQEEEEVEEFIEALYMPMEEGGSEREVSEKKESSEGTSEEESNPSVNFSNLKDSGPVAVSFDSSEKIRKQSIVPKDEGSLFAGAVDGEHVSSQFNKSDSQSELSIGNMSNYDEMEKEVKDGTYCFNYTGEIVEFKSFGEDSPRNARESEEEEHYYSFNDRFQDIIDELDALKANKESEKMMKANMKLIQLAQDFVSSATIYGKLIISEHKLPPRKRTVKPTTEVGGHLGGEKYIVNDILFKFAMDAGNIFKSLSKFNQDPQW